MLGLSFLLLLTVFIPKPVHNQEYIYPKEPVTITEPSIEDVKAEIIRQANIYGVDVNAALRIGFCESSYRWNAKNPHSSATGVYQWTKGTWKWIKAEGDRLDYKENIKQFFLWYPKYPQWWQCK